MGVTAEKMAAHLRRAVQAVFDRGLNDPRVRGLVSVTRIELSPDFRDATIFVSVMPQDETKLTMHGIKAATGHIRSQVARRANLPRTPTMHFKLDTVMRREKDVLAAIAKATAEDEAAARARGESPVRAEGVRGVDVDPATLAAFDAFLEETAATPAGDGEPTGPAAPRAPDWDEVPDADDAASADDNDSDRADVRGDHDH